MIFHLSHAGNTPLHIAVMLGRRGMHLVEFACCHLMVSCLSIALHCLSAITKSLVGLASARTTIKDHV